MVENGIQNSNDEGSISSGRLLCGALLKVYEGVEIKVLRPKGCGQGVWLVSKALCLLLASSQTAKLTALKGMIREVSSFQRVVCTDFNGVGT